MRKSLTVLVVSLMCSLAATAQSGSLQSDLEALHAKWFKAYDAGDAATMNQMESSNLVLVMPNGLIWAKNGPREQWKGVVGLQRTLNHVAVREFGDIAILTGVLTTTGAKEKEYNGEEATTVVFVRSGGAWKISSAQWTSVSER
jgi:ketosteroid isomerase-like protein